MTLYLRSDQSTLEQALIDAGVAQMVDGVFQEDTSRVDYIGTILKGDLARTRPEPITDSEGSFLSGIDNPVSGTHANVQTDDQNIVNSLSSVTITTPSTPYRVFA